MIIRRLSFCGFRGSRGPVELLVPSGFLVVAGLNGCGKSTICDAVEFALTGSVRAGSHSERRESINDYTWWRGSEPPRDRYVEVAIESPAGSEVIIKRTPEGCLVTGAESIVDALCGDGAPPDPVVQLCRTSILRDEEITALSVDLPETERFDLVRRAIGTTGFQPYELKLEELRSVLNEQTQRAGQEYNSARAAVIQLGIRLSEAQSQVTRASEIRDAESAIRRMLAVPTGTLANLLRDATRELTERTIVIERATALLEQLRTIDAELTKVRDPERIEQLRRMRLEAAATQVALDMATKELARGRKALSETKAHQPRLGALARLVESGLELGLGEGGKCPLCEAHVDQHAFEEHLAQMAQTIRAASDEMLAFEQRCIAAEQRVHELTSKQMSLSTERSAEEAVLGRRMTVTAELAALGVKGPDDRMSPSSVHSFIEQLRDSASTLSRWVTTIHASTITDEITRLEEKLAVAQTDVEEAERLIRRLSRASETAKQALDTLRRVSGEVIDDRLAAISPLLSELYIRLRPHADWRTIAYRMRGDVRKFLSFEVGDGLNPSFVFSSGQRRAVGMAFLLAVHLSRPWCKLKTLILDDPVQHVDDYRALNLTEVLSSIRRSGRQIVCTTEDSALAELMARRFRSTEIGEGLIVRMGYDSDVGVYVSDQKYVGPMPRNVLIPA